MSDKTSDKNVANIENVKEYKINLSQKQSVELLKDTLNKFEIRGEQLYLLKNAIENILAERKQDKLKIKELDTKQKAMCEEYCPKLDSIPVQKVKDKIEELENAKRETTRENWYYIYSIQLKILEELLEDK